MCASQSSISALFFCLLTLNCFYHTIIVRNSRHFEGGISEKKTIAVFAAAVFRARA